MSLSNPVCARFRWNGYGGAGAGIYGIYVDVPVIHMGMIVGGRDASIRIRPLQKRTRERRGG